MSSRDFRLVCVLYKGRDDCLSRESFHSWHGARKQSPTSPFLSSQALLWPSTMNHVITWHNIALGNPFHTLWLNALSLLLSQTLLMEWSLRVINIQPFIAAAFYVPCLQSQSNSYWDSRLLPSPSTNNPMQTSLPMLPVGYTLLIFRYPGCWCWRNLRWSWLALWPLQHRFHVFNLSALLWRQVSPPWQAFPFL